VRIVRVDGRDADVFRRFYELKFAVRREELEFAVGMGVEEARALMAGDHFDVRADGLGLVGSPVASVGAADARHSPTGAPRMAARSATPAGRATAEVDECDPSARKRRWVATQDHADVARR